MNTHRTAHHPAIAAALLACALTITMPDANAQVAQRAAGKFHILPATTENTQWGLYDSTTTPALTIQSGDTVVMETMNHAHDYWIPGRSLQDVLGKRMDNNPQRGPHSITGPVFVEGAEPGDVLKVTINRIVPRAYGYNITLPGVGGQFPKEFAEGRLRYFYIDLDKRQIEFLPGIQIPLKPFPGLIGVARKEPGPYSTRPPGEFGGNMDVRDLTAGTVLHFPVWTRGALLWSGDAHAAQGNGEINISAIETAFRELNLTFEVVKGRSLLYPRAEKQDSWITFGFDPDLDRAHTKALEETAKILIETHKVSADRGRTLTDMVADCRVSQVVNGTKGIHCLTPKRPGFKTDLARPRTDTVTDYVTYAEEDTLTKAMDRAALMMIDRIANEKKIDRTNSYALMSVALDCRVGDWTGSTRKVHCLLPKNLWTGTKK
jgi:acetamidase/formamidase